MSRASLSSAIALAAALALVGCGSDDSSNDSASATTEPVPEATSPATTLATTDPPATTEAPAPATTAAPTTTTTSEPEPEPTELERLLANGYGTSDEWRVETVIADIDAATGGIAVAPDGTIYQADFGDGATSGDRVLRIDPDGTISEFSQSDEFGLLTMTTFGPDGALYQSSYGTGKVFRLAEDGTPTLLAEGLRGPTGLVINDDGTIFAQAYDNGSINRIGTDGSVEEFARGNGLAGPNGLVQGPDGTLFSINHRNGGLFSVDADGTVTELHRFPAPTSHGVLLDGGLFITSRGSFVIYRYDIETGDIDVVAGNAEPGDRDGVGTETSFGRPNAITVGPDGALYFNHGEGTANSPVTIRRLVPNT